MQMLGGGRGGMGGGEGRSSGSSRAASGGEASFGEPVRSSTEKDEFDDDIPF